MGYDAGKCILTTQAAQAFASAQKIFLSMKPQPFSLKMYDCYRPQMAVNEFVLWSQNPDLLMKNVRVLKTRNKDKKERKTNLINMIFTYLCYSYIFFIFVFFYFFFIYLFLKFIV